MAAPRKKPSSSNVFERRLILVSAVVAALYLIVVGTWRDKIDYVYVIGLLFMVIGYFARDLTGSEDDDDEMQPPRSSS